MASGGRSAQAMNERYCFDAAAGTHPGWRYSENQDAVLLGRQVWQRPLIRTCGDRPQLLAGVADGVAFAPCAGRASSTVLQLLSRDVLARGELQAAAPREIQRGMTSLVAGTPCEGMAATLAALQLTQAGVRIVSVGDSRIYRLRQGEFQQLTVDHTLGRRLIATGEMTEQQVGCASSLYQDLDSTLCASESGSGFDIHHCVSDLRDADTWLCCTDGISQALPDSALAVLLAEASVPGAKVRAILDAARSNRDSDDNLSAIVVTVRVQSNGT